MIVNIFYTRLSLAFLMLISLCMCWPLEPRDAQDPSSYIQPKTAVSPQEIPEILEDVYNNKYSELYLKNILRDDFSFYSDPSELTGTRNWDKNTEASIFNKIISNYISISLKFEYTNEKDPIVSNAQVRITRNYKITVMDSSGEIISFAGKAEFLLEENSSSEWLIRQWYDFDTRGDTLDSWGQLKLKFN